MSTPRRTMTARVLSLADPEAGSATVLGDVSARLALVYHLSVAAWGHTGHAMPTYARREIPVTRFMRDPLKHTRAK